MHQQRVVALRHKLNLTHSRQMLGEDSYLGLEFGRKSGYLARRIVSQTERRLVFKKVPKMQRCFFSPKSFCHLGNLSFAQKFLPITTRIGEATETTPRNRS